MKCISCETQIDPKWKSAIDKNECPFCGEEILNAALKEMLSSLYAVLSALDDFPEELEDWMLSNFGYIKTSSPDLVNYVPADLLSHASRAKQFMLPNGQRLETITLEDGKEQNVYVSKNQTEDETNSFFARAEANKVGGEKFNSVEEKNRELKNKVNKIKKQAEFGSEEMLAEDTFDSEFEQIVRQDIGRTAAFNTSGDTGEDIPDIVQQIAYAASNGGQQRSSADLEILRNHMSKKAQSQEAFENGERATSRSGAPAGFSRSG